MNEVNLCTVHHAGAKPPAAALMHTTNCPPIVLPFCLQAMGDDARAEKRSRTEEAPETSSAAAGGAAATSSEAAGGTPDAVTASSSRAAPSGAGGGAGVEAAATGDAMQVDGAAGGDDDENDAGSSGEDELEAELVRTVAGTGRDDPLAAYDIDVQEDGEAIQMYLSLLASSSTSSASGC